LAVLVPPIVEVLKKIMVPVMGRIPKPFIPILAAVIGAIGEMLITQTPGNFVMGAAAGAGGTGVRDVVKNLGSSS